MEFGFNPETIMLVLLVISILYAFISTWKKYGLKKALLAVMRTIENVKINEETKEKVSAAITIANEVKSDWNKRSPVKKIAKIGKLIDDIYEAEVKDVEKWKTKFDGELR